MKQKKDISDLIRENQHKLDETPSQRTWKRLESKLDNKQSRSRTFLYRQMAMAAAVVALVAVISLITVMSNQKNTKFATAEMAMDKSADNWVIQDLETVYTDANTNIRKVVEFQLKLKDSYSKPIQEGLLSKKLLASNNTHTGSMSKWPNTSNELIAMNKESRNFNYSSNAAVAYDSNVKLEDNSSGTESEILKPDAVAFQKRKTTDARKEKANSKVKTTIKAEKKYLTETQRMEWILGTWVENNNTHEWQKVNATTILCDKYFIKERSDGGLYFKISDEPNVSYKLTSEEIDVRIFTNENSGQVIVKKLGIHDFSITFLKNGSIKKEEKLFKRLGQ